MQTARGTGLIEQLPPLEPSPRSAGSLQWAGLLAVAAAVVVADQVTKHLIVDRIALGDGHRVLPFLEITHLRNTGIAFGIFPGRLEVVSLLTALAVVWMLAHFAKSGSRHVLFPVALGTGERLFEATTDKRALRLLGDAPVGKQLRLLTFEVLRNAA